MKDKYYNIKIIITNGQSSETLSFTHIDCFRQLNDFIDFIYKDKIYCFNRKYIVYYFYEETKEDKE